MTRPALTRGQRRALRAAIREARKARAAAGDTLPPAPPGELSDLSADDLWSYALALGVDTSAVLASTGDTPADPRPRVSNTQGRGQTERNETRQANPMDATPQPALALAAQAAMAAMARGPGQDQDQDTDTAPADAAETVTEETTPPAEADPQEVTEQANTLLLAAFQAVATSSGDVGAARDVLRPIVARALSGPATVTRTVTRTVTIERQVAAPASAPAGETPYATSAGTAPIGTLFPDLSKEMPKALRDRLMRKWQSAPGMSPTVDPDYHWTPALVPALSALSRGEHVFLWGPAGTGKTTAAEQIAARLGREYVRISCTATTEAAELVGMTVPAVGGGTRWQDGQLTRAIRRPGSLILIDEPSVARPGALFVLQAVLDSRRLYIAETGEVVTVAPGVLFLAGDNTNGTGDETGAYEDTGRLNRATLDRFGACIRLDYLATRDEAAVLMRRARCAGGLALVLSEFATVTRAKVQAGDLTHGVGLRRLVSLAALLSDGLPVDMALRAAVLETAPPADREVLEQLATAKLTQAAITRAMRQADIPAPEPTPPPALPGDDEAKGAA